MSFNFDCGAARSPSGHRNCYPGERGRIQSDHRQLTNYKYVCILQLVMNLHSSVPVSEFDGMVFSVFVAISISISLFISFAIELLLLLLLISSFNTLNL